MKGRLFLVSDTMPTFGSDIASFTVGAADALKTAVR